MKYDAVIFDKDGVLLDSMNESSAEEKLWYDRSRAEIAEKKGFNLTAEEVKGIVKAQSEEELEEFSRSTGLSISDITDIEKNLARKKIEKIKSGEIQLFSQAEKVLEAIDRPKSLVSNAPWMATEFTVKKFELGKHFEAVESPSLENVRRYTEIKKPAPYMVEKVIRVMEADNPVMVGDSSDDVKVAENAGIDSVFVNTNGGTDLDPTYRVEELQEILDIV